MSMDRELLMGVIEAGIKAPSGDNCQPWRFRLLQDGIQVINDGPRDTSLYNANNIASYIAHGALIENMRISAATIGRDTVIRLFPSGGVDGVVACLEFKKSDVKADRLLPQIERRCTNRRAYKKTPLPGNAAEALRGCAGSIGGGEVFLVEGRTEMETAAKAASLNDRLLFENRRLHDFLFEHIRWSKKEAEECGDGLDIRTLGLNALQRMAFRAMRQWQAVRIANLCGFSRIAQSGSYRLCAGSSALGMILMDGTSDNAFVQGGRLLQRVWLTAASLGLAFQPMTGVTFLIQRLRMAGGEGLNEGHRELLRKAEKDLLTVFPMEKGRAVIMLFRVGYAPEPVRSLRRAAMLME